MTGIEADLLAAKLSIHLRSNNFAVCREILDYAEQEAERTERTDPWDRAIAETDLDLRWVNALEADGYLYLKDLRDVNLQTLEVVGIGRRAKEHLRKLLALTEESLYDGCRS